jgi:PPOX class probable F420-dependent enzyme
VDARERFASAPVARLATVGRDGAPHVVVITFAVDGDAIYTAVDSKPKRTQRLKRLENVRHEPRVALLADHYDDDWSRLWWVRADGRARVVERGEELHDRAVELLTARYEQYRSDPPSGPAIFIAVDRWSQWPAEGS